MAGLCVAGTARGAGGISTLRRRGRFPSTNWARCGSARTTARTGVAMVERVTPPEVRERIIAAICDSAGWKERAPGASLIADAIDREVIAPLLDENGALWEEMARLREYQVKHEKCIEEDAAAFQET